MTSLRTGAGPYCENCGIETTPYGQPAEGLICDGCRRWHAVIAAAHIVLSWLALALIVWYGMPHLIAAQTADIYPTTQPGTIYLAFYASLMVGVCLHESAHAACAGAFRFSVPRVRIGSGPLVFRGRLGRTVVEVHLIPLSGVTLWRPGLSKVTTTRRACIAAAGPATNLILAALAWSLRAHSPDLAIPAACGNLLLFVQNVLPRPPRNVGDTPNDGWQIFKNLSGSHWARAHLRQLELASKCAAFTGPDSQVQATAYLRGEILSRDGDDPDAEAMLCGYLLEPGGHPDAIKEGFERSSRLLEDRRAAPMLRASALNGRAFMLAVGGWPHLMEEAEWAAHDALRFLPGHPDVRGTMGLVLVRLGRFDEAEPMIKTAINHNLRAITLANGPAPVRRTRALAANRCALALLYAQTNRSDAAANELAHARASDSACPLLPELDLMLGPVGVLED